MIMKFKIFQIINTEKNGKIYYRFMWWEYAKPDFNPRDYDEVYSGEREAVDEYKMLDDLWYEFNVNHPVDFCGHSMSMSDVIVVENNGNWKYFYCDKLGFEDITEIWKEMSKLL